MTHPQSSQHSLMRPMVDIHDRMPVILTDENEKGGLTYNCISTKLAAAI